jgi:hypothetical protein
MAAVRQLYNRELTIGLGPVIGCTQSLIFIAARKARQTVCSYIFVCYPKKGGNEAATITENNPFTVMG